MRYDRRGLFSGGSRNHVGGGDSGVPTRRCVFLLKTDDHCCGAMGLVLGELMTYGPLILRGSLVRISFPHVTPA